MRDHQAAISEHYNFTEWSESAKEEREIMRGKHRGFESGSLAQRMTDGCAKGRGKGANELRKLHNVQNP